MKRFKRLSGAIGEMVRVAVEMLAILVITTVSTVWGLSVYVQAELLGFFDSFFLELLILPIIVVGGLFFFLCLLKMFDRLFFGFTVDSLREKTKKENEKTKIVSMICTTISLIYSFLSLGACTALLFYTPQYGCWLTIVSVTILVAFAGYQTGVGTSIFINQLKNKYSEWKLECQKARGN